ncbi:MAG TPA: class I SAM-dependent methyltransferase [Bryobacteraceae bacterium]|nr:class I SAM-dependent methyltransferase [Bryobacteraceae bacterium]
MRVVKKSCFGLLIVALSLATLVAQQKTLREPDVVFVPTPQEVVDGMLKLANVRAGDVLYDLGCGDGRTVISAARLGAKATGIDINPVRIKESEENAASQGMTGKVKFLLADLFEADFKDATVVTLYLLPSLNVKLRPKLWQLKPGTRIVSHDFDMGDWKAEKTLDLDGHTIYLWTVPAKPPVLN